MPCGRVLDAISIPLIYHNYQRADERSRTADLLSTSALLIRSHLFAEVHNHRKQGNTLDKEDLDY